MLRASRKSGALIKRRALQGSEPGVFGCVYGCDRVGLGRDDGDIIVKSYQLMVEVQPDAVLVLGDTNSGLSVIGAKWLHIPIFHIEAGNRCKDECLPEETNRRNVDIISDVKMAYSEQDCGLRKERTRVTGSLISMVHALWIQLKGFLMKRRPEL